MTTNAFQDGPLITMSDIAALKHGKRAKVTFSDKSWAVGKTGTIVNHSLANLYTMPSGYEIPILYQLQMDDMDPLKPPFGLANFYADELEILEENQAQKIDDPVNHPSHYTDGKYEVIDYIESRGYNDDFYIANAVKYISRAGKKDPNKRKEDLQKAIWYLKRKRLFKEADNLPSISTDDYISDKKLDGTGCGLALDAIDKQQPDLAIRALEMELDR